ncbi:MAG: hypothetical protein H7144_04835 [Burkholderiales bacterium]|nr:hypothetical protein [Phycisphaerae bacterium]
MKGSIGIERLEDRKLFSTNVAIVDGVLQITDDDDGHHVRYRYNAGTYTVTVDGTQIFSSVGRTWNTVEIRGMGGNDKLEHMTNETLSMGITMLGGDGDDSLIGAKGSDVLNGEAGNDSLNGGAGSDTLHGGDDSDTIYASTGNDQSYGDAGTDTMDGRGINQYGGLLISLDDVYNDQVLGSAQNVHDDFEVLYGNNDNGDTLIGSSTGFAAIYGLGGNDTLTAAGAGDALYGGDNNDLLNGSAGDDYLDGGGYTDVLYGGDGNDTLVGGSGRDSVFGQAGDDTVYQDTDISIDVLDGGTGTDTLYSATNLVLDLVSNFEVII